MSETLLVRGEPIQRVIIKLESKCDIINFVSDIHLEDATKHNVLVRLMYTSNKTRGT